MNHKQKLGYMALGALIMLIGMGVGSTFFIPPIEAQHNGFFDTITCRELKVVDKQGNVAVALNTDDANRVLVNDKQGKEAVELKDTEYGGRVNVYNNQGKNRAAMGVNEYGNGGVNTWDKDGYRQ